jgi:hypothetical protein
MPLRVKSFLRLWNFESDGDIGNLPEYSGTEFRGVNYLNQFSLEPILSTVSPPPQISVHVITYLEYIGCTE